MARGDLKSYPLEELVEQAKKAFAEGVKELWLTSEDLGAWGRDRDMVLLFIFVYRISCNRRSRPEAHRKIKALSFYYTECGHVRSSSASLNLTKYEKPFTLKWLQTCSVCLKKST